MQTFLPYPSFFTSAQCLDRQRLGKQRVECLQLLTALTKGNRWSNHPAAKMWRGYEHALVAYGIDICKEWIKRGYKDTCLEKIRAFLPPEYRRFEMVANPPWLGRDTFHASHRSNLLRKDPIWYGKFGWLEPNNLPYVWPVS